MRYRTEKETATIDFTVTMDIEPVKRKNIMRLFCILKILNNKAGKILTDRYNGGFLYQQFLPLEHDPYDFEKYINLWKKDITLYFNVDDEKEKEFYDVCLKDKSNDEMLDNLIQIFAHYFEIIDKVEFIADEYRNISAASRVTFDPKEDLGNCKNFKTISLLLNPDYKYDRYICKKILSNKHNYTYLIDEKYDHYMIILRFDLDNEEEMKKYHSLLEEGSYVGIKVRLIQEFEEQENEQ